MSKREWLKHGAEKAEVGRRWGRVESYSHSGAAGLALTNNQSLGAHHLAGGALGLWSAVFLRAQGAGPHACYIWYIVYRYVGTRWGRCDGSCEVSCEGENASCDGGDITCDEVL